MRKADRIRELAPFADTDDGEIFDEVLGDRNGQTEVLTASGRSLGSLDLGGTSSATVIVEMVGVSRSSGGELYKPLSIHTTRADHYIIDTLPEIVLEPVPFNAGQQG